jgi:carbon-monoxide dehydrogenase large subunit
MHILFVKRILGEELDIPGNLVKLNRGDSDELKQGVGTWGSRSAVAAGAALTEAARMLRSKVERSLGSYSLENLLSDEFDAEVFRSEEEQVNSFGANTAVVRINQFGVARVVEIGACYDIGRNLSPDVVMNQIIGGSLQGIGQALYESVVHDSEGKLATRDLYDAGLPIAENLPDFNVKIVERPSKLPHGAKGLGEAPTIGVPIAVVRALEKTTMHRIRNTPVLPEELMDHKNKPNFTKPRAQ